MTSSASALRAGGWLTAVAMVTVTIVSAAPVVRPPDDRRVNDLLSRMSLQEQLGLIAGGTEPPDTYQGQAGWLPGIPRLGIPPLRLADGPPGVLTREVSGAAPATMALAATFSTQDAEAIGAFVGENARARGIDVILQPYINLYRDPEFGRAYNTYGEDPLLSGAVGAAFVLGAQAQGVMAQAKHFIAYDGGADVKVAPQALHELYLAPFADVARAGVSSVMCSYNKINGLYACGNATMQQDLLRRESGFDGFITSDWGALHGAEFIMAGLDMDMPGEVSGPMSVVMKPYFVTHPVSPPDPDGLKTLLGAFLGAPGGSPEFDEPAPPFNLNLEMLAPGYSQTLGEAMQAGRVPPAAITAAARHVLRQIERFGYLDGRQKHTVTEEDAAAHAPLLRRVASDAAVLLKNDGILPLKSAELGNTLFVGPGAAQNIAIGDSGEKALGWTVRQIGAAEALRQDGQRVQLVIGDDMAGVAIPSIQFVTDGAPGLNRVGPDDTHVRDAAIDFTSKGRNALPAGGHYIWNGTLHVPSAGDYNLNLQMLGCSARLDIDGQLLGQTTSLFQHGDVLQAGQDNLLPTPDGLDNVRKGIHLTAGDHAVRIEATADTSGAPMQVRLAWITPQMRVQQTEALIDAAKSAKTVVFFAWSHSTAVGMKLPGRQNELIERVASANPNTVVVLNTSGPVRMPWLGHVRAVVEMWYSGDEGGRATADVLTGRISPAGRLPFTWARQSSDYPSLDSSHPERSSNAKVTEYSEGLYMGYRGFDKNAVEPLFPFGYGLSYAHFQYRDLRTSRAPDGGLDVSFVLANDSTVDGDEVPQVYLGAPMRAPAGIDFAPQALAAFARVHLAAGRSQSVRLHIAPRALEYWSETDHGWRRSPNGRTLSVRTSSRDARLSVRL